MTSSIVDPGTLADFLSGTWKRNLEWRHFGPSFEFAKMSNSIVRIDKYHNSKTPNSVYLQWSFGEKSLDPKTLSFGYVMKITSSNTLNNNSNNIDKKLKNTQQTMSDKKGLLLLEWQYSGEQCSGWYHIRTHTLSLNFVLKNSSVQFTYRIIDDSTMVVSTVEIDEDHTPTLQFGQMCRINMKKYQKLLNENEKSNY